MLKVQVSRIAAATFLTSVIAVPVAAQDDGPRYRATLGFDFTSGTYGADEATDIVFMPLTVQAEDGPWTARAVVPWLHVSGPALILDGAEGGSVGTRTTDSASGLGDVSVLLMYSLDELWERGTFIDVTARVKIPTASLSAGLGTGEPDAALQLDVAQSFGPFIPFATVGYKWAGVPPGFKLRNTAYGSIGLQYSWSERVATGLSYDYRQSAIRESEDPQEGLAYLNIRMNDAWSVNLYAVMGFSENSPDDGAGIAFVYRFP